MKKRYLHTAIFLLAEGCILAGTGFLLHAYNYRHSLILVSVGIVSFLMAIPVALVGVATGFPLKGKSGVANWDMNL
ncbi:MAG TPA: hypothetical protein VG870_09805 [Chitinophagaceae bacterium]|nr:hypothetical protein [Chitinophagaceae bacterium]